MTENTTDEQLRAVLRWKMKSKLSSAPMCNDFQSLMKFNGHIESLQQTRWTELLYILTAIICGTIMSASFVAMDLEHHSESIRRLSAVSISTVTALHPLSTVQLVFPTPSTTTFEVTGSATPIVRQLTLCALSAPFYMFALAVLYSRSPIRTATAFLVALVTVLGFSQRLTEYPNEIFIIFLPAGVNVALFIAHVFSRAWSAAQDFWTMENGYGLLYKLVRMLGTLDSMESRLSKIEIEWTRTASGRDMGRDDPTSGGNLARIYSKHGRDSEELALQDTGSGKRSFGQDYPADATRMTNLTSTYSLHGPGRWTAAEVQQVQVIETGQRVLDPGSYPVAVSCTDDWKIQRFPDARDDEAFAHTDTTNTSTSNLALTYRKQGRCTESQESQLKFVEETNSQIRDHPDTLVTMNNLVQTYESQGHMKENVSFTDNVSVHRSSRESRGDSDQEICRMSLMDTRDEIEGKRDS